MNLEDSLFVAFAIEWKDDVYRRGKKKGQPCKRHPVTDKARDLTPEEVRERQEKERPPERVPLELGANLDDFVDHMMLADKAEEEGRPWDAEHHRQRAFELDWRDNEEQILADHPAALPRQTLEERRYAVEKVMADSANLPQDDPRHHNPYLTGAYNNEIVERPPPERLNAIADAAEAVAWKRDVAEGSNPIGQRKHLHDRSSMLDVYKEARKRLPDLGVMEFHKALAVLERARQVQPWTINRHDDDQVSSQDWALAMPFTRRLAHDVMLLENGDGFTFRARFRPDGSLMNLGHGDVIARAYARRNDPNFSDEDYRTAGQIRTAGSHQPSGYSLSWLSRPVGRYGDGPKQDELERLAGLMGIPVEPAPDADQNHGRELAHRNERLQQQILSAYSSGRSKDRPEAGWLDHDLRPGGSMDSATSERLHEARQEQHAQLSDDQRVAYKAMIAADEARGPAAGSSSEERRHAKERTWGLLVRSFGADPTRSLDQQPVSPDKANLMAKVALAYENSERVGRFPAGQDAWPLLRPVGGSSGLTGREGWSALRKWYDARWKSLVPPEKQWYEFWK